MDNPTYAKATDQTSIIEVLKVMEPAIKAITAGVKIQDPMYGIEDMENDLRYIIVEEVPKYNPSKTTMSLSGHLKRRLDLRKWDICNKRTEGTHYSSLKRGRDMTRVDKNDLTSSLLSPDAIPTPPRGRGHTLASDYEDATMVCYDPAKEEEQSYRANLAIKYWEMASDNLRKVILWKPKAQIGSTQMGYM